MKKIYILITCFFLMLGCTTSKNNTTADTSNGPVVKEDSRTNEEKILSMIQSCIKNYNEDDLDELRTYYKSNIPNLPLELDSLPEVNALSELTSIVADDNSNTVYEGMYKVDKYKITFKIYYPSGADFWPNGDIDFQIDPEDVTVNNPEYEGYRNALTYLLSEESNVIYMLYGANVELADEPSFDDKYYEVIRVNGEYFSSIDELKEYAETVFIKEYLEGNYYKNSFESETPVYKEVNGKLYCIGAEVTPIVSYQYAPEYIIYVKDENGIIKVNLLTKVMDTILPDIKEITLQETENGYRLAFAG